MAFLEMWTVYDHPRDYPQGYIARKFVADANGARPTPEVITSPTLALIRESMMRMGRVCLTRDPQDDPNIIETWL